MLELPQKRLLCRAGGLRAQITALIRRGAAIPAFEFFRHFSEIATDAVQRLPDTPAGAYGAGGVTCACTSETGGRLRITSRECDQNSRRSSTPAATSVAMISAIAPNSQASAASAK